MHESLHVWIKTPKMLNTFKSETFCTRKNRGHCFWNAPLSVYLNQLCINTLKTQNCSINAILRHVGVISSPLSNANLWVLRFAFDNCNKMTPKRHEPTFVFLLKCFYMYPLHLYFWTISKLSSYTLLFRRIVLLINIPMTNCLARRGLFYITIKF